LANLTTPVVLLIYRRPDTTRRVVERIAAARPDKLLVVADGPRDASEKPLCEAARDVIREVTWPGEVVWHVSDQNMGARYRVSSGIDWAFTQVEEAIILEDDCLPEPGFFDFCVELLDRYRDDERIMQIGGSSLTGGSVPVDGSYYFSKYFHTWGWATWRRAWRHFDEGIARWPMIKQTGAFAFDDWVEKRFWTKLFDRVYDRDIDTCWDYQWMFAMWCQSGMSVVPRANLVTNIGFGAGGTHYTKDHPFARIASGSLDGMVHPDVVMRNVSADRAEFRAAGNRFERLARVSLGRLRRRVQRLRTKR